jgi:hypothetical protein
VPVLGPPSLQGFLDSQPARALLGGTTFVELPLSIDVRGAGFRAAHLHGHVPLA